MTCEHRCKSRAWALLPGVLAILWATPAAAFKWHECPAPPVPVHPSVLGASSSPFAHPGHEVSIFLNEAEIEATGGFSMDEGGNEIAITFVSLFGEPIALAPRVVAATAVGVLTFDFPDTFGEVGRTLAGPVELLVTTAGKETARIAPTDFVGLPAAADISGLLLGEEVDRIIHAAIGANGDLWVPAYFAGKHMPMPGCEGSFIMPVALEVGGASVIGPVLFPFDPATRIRGIQGYLGDMIINGVSFYGMLYDEPIEMVQVGDTLGVSVCRLNDAEDLVLRVLGNSSWAGRASPYRLVARDSAPLALRLHKAPPVPRSATAVERSRALTAPGRVDSFGNRCEQPLMVKDATADATEPETASSAPGAQRSDGGGPPRHARAPER